MEKGGEEERRGRGGGERQKERDRERTQNVGTALVRMPSPQGQYINTYRVYCGFFSLIYFEKKLIVVSGLSWKVGSSGHSTSGAWNIELFGERR